MKYWHQGSRSVLLYRKISLFHLHSLPYRCHFHILVTFTARFLKFACQQDKQRRQKFVIKMQILPHYKLHLRTGLLTFTTHQLHTAVIFYPPFYAFSNSYHNKQNK